MEHQPSSEGEISPFSFFCLSGALQPLVQTFSYRAEVEKKVSDSFEDSNQTCKCKKSRCLKMYCDCFANQKYCNNCSCVNCVNLPEAEEVRQTAIRRILEKNPRAFGVDLSYRSCRCKKSSCLKNYCECFQKGLKCGRLCKCEDCQNTGIQ